MIRIKILNDNQNILNHLKEGFDDFYSDKLEFKICHSSQELFENSEEYDILISDFSKVHTEPENYKDTAYAVMSCDKSGNPEFPCFEIYQNVHEIYKNLNSIVEEYKSKKYDYRKLFKIKPYEMAVFFSCNGGAGSTTIAKAYALNKSQHNNSVYIPFVPFSSENCDNKFGISEILSGETVLNFENEKLLKLNPIDIPTDLEKYDFSVFDKYKEKIYLSVDADFSCYTVLPVLLKSADKIYFVISDDKSSLKVSAMKKYVSAICPESVGKIKLVYNNYNGNNADFTDAISIKHIDNSEIIENISREVSL